MCLRKATGKQTANCLNEIQPQNDLCSSGTPLLSMFRASTGRKRMCNQRSELVGFRHLSTSMCSKDSHQLSFKIIFQPFQSRIFHVNSKRTGNSRRASIRELLRGPKRAAVTQGSATLSGRIPDSMYAWDNTLPTTTNAFTSIVACTAGYNMEPQSKNLRNTASKKAENISLVTPPVSIAFSPHNLM